MCKKKLFSAPAAYHGVKHKYLAISVTSYNLSNMKSGHTVYYQIYDVFKTNNVFTFHKSHF